MPIRANLLDLVSQFYFWFFLKSSGPRCSDAFVVLVAMNSVELFMYLVSLGFLAFKLVSSQYFHSSTR